MPPPAAQPWGSVREVDGGWQARLPRAADSGRRSIGVYRTRAAAARALLVARTAIEAGTWVAPWAGPEPEPAPPLTVAALVAAYVDASEAHLAPKTILSYQSITRRLIAPAPLGTLPAAALDRAAVVTWQDGLRAKGVGASQRLQARRLLSVSCGDAVDRGGLVTNPVAGVRERRSKAATQGTQGGGHVILSWSELARLRDAAPTPAGALAIEVLAWSGLRLGELSALRKRDLIPHNRLAIERSTTELVGGGWASARRRVAWPGPSPSRLPWPPGWPLTRTSWGRTTCCGRPLVWGDPCGGAFSGRPSSGRPGQRPALVRTPLTTARRAAGGCGCTTCGRPAPRFS